MGNQRKNYKTEPELNNIILQDLNSKKIDGGDEIKLIKLFKQSVNNNDKQLPSSAKKAISAIIYNRWSENIDPILEKIDLDSIYQYWLHNKDEWIDKTNLLLSSKAIWENASSPKDCGEKMNMVLKLKILKEEDSHDIMIRWWEALIMIVFFILRW